MRDAWLGFVLFGAAMMGCSASGQSPHGGPSLGASGGMPQGAAGPIFEGAGGDVSLGGLGPPAGRSGVDGVDGGCGTLSIDTTVQEVVTPGNVLIIFDQSDSMSTADFNGQVRWKAASDALVAAITPNQDVLTIGAIFFPSFAGSLLICDPASVSAIDDATSKNPQIPFMPGATFLDAWAQHWASNPLRLGTPIDIGLQRGDEALTAAALKGNTIVIFVTDGEPSCTVGATASTLPAKWLAAGIPTHVVGLPGAAAGAGARNLQTIAMAGGTQNYLTPSDGAELEQQVSAIASTIVKHSLDSCQIKLSEKPLGDVVLVVTEAADGKKYGVKPGADGWTLAADGSTATLNGATCTDASSGRFSNLSFAFACANVPLLR